MYVVQLYNHSAKERKSLKAQYRSGIHAHDGIHVSVKVGLQLCIAK